MSDADAQFDAVVELKPDEIKPQVTWGTSPEMVLARRRHVPDPATRNRPGQAATPSSARSNYMGLEPDQAITDIQRGPACSSAAAPTARIEDLRAAAEVAKGRKVAATVKQALVVPGSGLVKAQAEAEGLDKVFIEAGFEWREPGCSMCLAMNPDRWSSGEHCASTSNRNFEGRQGAGGAYPPGQPGHGRGRRGDRPTFVDVRELIQA